MPASDSRRSFIKRSATFGGLTIAAASLPWSRVALGGESKARDLFATINRAADPDHLTGLEAKHVPVVKVPELVREGEIFSMHITVGKTVHPMLANHWINEVTVLTDDGTPIAKVELTPAVAQPVALLQLKLDEPMTFRVLERCTLHGLWEAVREIKVQ